MKTSRDDEHFTANPISISLLSKKLLRLETMFNIFDHSVFVDPWKRLLFIIPVSGLRMFVSECCTGKMQKDRKKFNSLVNVDPNVTVPLP
jgi:hypothetical protein